MGDNNEIRKRLEFFHKVLLAIVWIIAVSGVIGGVQMMDDRYLRIFGIIMIIVSIFEGFLGHFLVNVILSIPFILLNNGDYLAAIVPEGKLKEINDIPVDKKEKPIVGINLYKEPTYFSGIVKCIQKEDNVKLISEHNNAGTKWLYVETTDGIKGYCIKGSINIS